MRDYSKLYIDGAWVASASEDVLKVVNSTTEEVMAEIPEAIPVDVDRAILAARKAFNEFQTTTPAERSDLLNKIAAGLRERREEIADLIAQEVGMPRHLSLAIQASLPATVAESYANLVQEFPFETTLGNSRILREPVGVVGCITPWNYPLHQIVAKVAPAIAAGCTVVVKPSEIAPLNAFVLAEVCDDVGLPPGVFNLVTGLGPIVGEAIAAHREIDMVSFTGSTRAGQRVAELAAASIKRVTQELGGKSANVILDDADLKAAVKTGVGNCFLNSGQTCSAWTRMLVPRDLQNEAVALARQAAERFRVGDPMAPGTKLGPLVSHVQRERVRSYIRRGLDEGATLVTGGAESPEDLPKGYFVRPTVFADVTSEMTIAQEEIFGPVLAILPYDDEEDAVRIANDTVYGLSGAVWSADPERAERVARRLRTGQVDINGGKYNPLAPFGGYKKSGNGRELGPFGLEEYLETKSLQMP